MTITKIILLVITLAIGYLSPRVLLTTALMVAGVLVSSLVRAVFKKETFKWPAIFHKGCATIHWGFISFYVFSFDQLRKDLRYSPMEITLFILLASFVLYVSGGFVTRKVLDNPEPGFLNTAAERESAWLATISLLVALLFARVLIRPVPAAKAITTERTGIGLARYAEVHDERCFQLPKTGLEITI